MKKHSSRKQVILGQPSWQIFSDRITAAVTEQGGHLGPVDFRLRGRTVSPYSVAPWAEERLPLGTPTMLKSLRGDFFCAPFGGNETACRRERHPPHGESANARWKFEARTANAESQTLHLSLETTVRKGRIDKWIGLRTGETNLYCRHVLSRMQDAINFGHHAMLRFPMQEGSGLLTTSRILHGQVAPLPFEQPPQGGYQSLKPGSLFTRLDRVPTANGDLVDLRKYPARRGFEDLVMVVHESEPDFAWTAVTFSRERYVWFSLKDPRVLRSTILWISNGGRHYPPWNGRHVNVLGIEDVTSYFHYGLAESVRRNPVNQLGFPTCVRLSKTTPLTVNYIMGVASIPRRFDKVQSIQRCPGGIRLASSNGLSTRAAVHTDFLKNHET